LGMSGKALAYRLSLTSKGLPHYYDLPLPSRVH